MRVNFLRGGSRCQAENRATSIRDCRVNRPLDHLGRGPADRTGISKHQDRYAGTLQGSGGVRHVGEAPQIAVVAD